MRASAAKSQPVTAGGAKFNTFPVSQLFHLYKSICVVGTPLKPGKLTHTGSFPTLRKKYSGDSATNNLYEVECESSRPKQCRILQQN